jgi:hypothetical protein
MSDERTANLIGSIAEQLEAHEKSRQAELLELAESGSGTRCWLQGTNDDDKKFVLTVYGSLTWEQRRRIIDLAREIDASSVAPPGEQREARMLAKAKEGE